MSTRGVTQSNSNWAMYNWGNSGRTEGLTGTSRSAKASESLRQKLQNLNKKESQKQDPTKPKVFQSSSESVISKAQKYTGSLQMDRTNMQKTKQAVKKMQYNFKDVSSKILRSKTSMSAKQVVGQAKREVARLKRALASGEYNSEDLATALAHAKAVERIAKKKAKHLEQEEIATAASKGKEQEERIENSVTHAQQARESSFLSEEPIREDFASEEPAPKDFASEVPLPEEISVEEISSTEIAEASLENWDMMMSAEEIIADYEDFTLDMMADLSDAYDEMLENLGFDELSESLRAASGEMTPEDIKLMKVEHRSKEVRDLMKADMEYLKAMFDHLEKQQQADSTAAISGPTTTPISGGSAPSIQEALAAVVPSIDYSV